MTDRKPPLTRTEIAEKVQLDRKLVHAMRYLPLEVKRRFVVDFDGDATSAFGTLLRGASHICPNCQTDFSPTNHKGIVLSCSCDKPSVHALRLYFEMAGAVGPATQILVNLNQSLGVRDDDELRELVTLGRRFEQLTNDASKGYEDLLLEGLDLVKMVLAHLPEKRAQVIADLGGVMPERNGGTT